MSFVRYVLSSATVLAGLAASAGTVVAQDPPSLPYVSRIYTVPEQPNTQEPTALVLAGEFPTGCGSIEETRVIDPHHVSLRLREYQVCDTPHDWGAYFGLGLLPAGYHQVEIALTYTGIDSADTSRTYHGRFEFFVRGDFPPADPTRYIRDVQIGPRPDSLAGVQPICPDDSILVRISGWFPSICYRVRSVELIEPPYGYIGPVPPWVRLVVGPDSCRAICAGVLGSWDVSVILPPLPADDYRLRIQMAESCADSVPPYDAFHSRDFPFVVNRCEPPGPCVFDGWLPSDAGACLGPGRPVDVTFGVSTSVALAGLEGSFTVWPSEAARISRIETTGSASDMHLSWVPTTTGARYVLFAEHGAPILPDSLPPGQAPPMPILRLTLETIATQLPPYVSVSGSELLGSDIEGQAVPRCPIMTLVPIEARICTQRFECDFDGDARLDIRDIVLMVHCVLPDSADTRPLCADSSRVADCDDNGAKDLADVICCALRILHDGDCPECPPDTSATRPAPGVSVAFGAPDVTETTVEIPFEIRGLEGLGGAVVALGFPADRYDAAVSFHHDVFLGWLTLADVRNGEALVGFVDVRSPGTEVPAYPIAPGPMMVLRLTLKPGRAHGGTITVNRGEFSGLDGVKLDVSLGRPSVAIDAAPRLALSEGRPNPFAGETRLSLTLDRGADADVGVYDLGGRRTATLHRGHLGPGAHDVVWRGTSDEGRRAPSGIYFLRVTARGASAVRKVVLIGN